MNSIIARYDLPDTWAGKGACPVCRVRGRLQVAHQTVTPDQLWCAACDAAFEVESGGAHVRLVRLPAAGTPADPEQLLEHWLLPSELAALLAAAQAAVEPAPPEPTPSPSPTLPSKHALNETVRELLYGSDEAEPPATPAKPAVTPAASAAETLLANLRSDVPAVAPRPVTAPLPAAPIEPVMAVEDEPAALLSALLADLPATPAPVDEAAFLDTLAAQAATSAEGETPPAEPGDAAALLAQLLDDLPASAPADEATFLEALAAGNDTTLTEPPTERGLMTAGDKTVAVPEVVIIVPDPPDGSELAARAMQLYKLGNSLALIETALQRTGASADQIAMAMREVRALEQQRLARHASGQRMMIGAGLLAVLLVLGAVALSALLPPVTAAPSSVSGTPGPTITPGGPTLTPTPAYNFIIGLINLIMPSDVKIVNGPTPPPGPTSELLAQLFPPTPTLLPEQLTAVAATHAVVQATAEAMGTAVKIDDGVPDWIRELIPVGIDVIGVSTPAVADIGPPPADCPLSATLAAAVFGGDAANWSYDRDTNGWFMTAFATPITIRVPANMTAGFMVLYETIEMRTVHGPVTIENINFIAISCE